MPDGVLNTEDIVSLRYCSALCILFSGEYTKHTNRHEIQSQILMSA